MHISCVKSFDPQRPASLHIFAQLITFRTIYIADKPLSVNWQSFCRAKPCPAISLLPLSTSSIHPTSDSLTPGSDRFSRVSLVSSPSSSH